MKNHDRRIKVIQAWLDRLNDDAGGARYLLRAFAGARWPVNNQKIKILGVLKRLFRRGVLFNPNTGFKSCGEASALPVNASMLLNVEVSNLDAKPCLGCFAR
jgi:hypothetical protein